MRVCACRCARRCRLSRCSTSSRCFLPCGVPLFSIARCCSYVCRRGARRARREEGEHVGGAPGGTRSANVAAYRMQRSHTGLFFPVFIATPPHTHSRYGCRVAFPRRASPHEKMGSSSVAPRHSCSRPPRPSPSHETAADVTSKREKNTREEKGRRRRRGYSQRGTCMLPT